MKEDGLRFPAARSPKRKLFAFVVENLGTRIIRGELNPLLPFPKEADLLFHRAILVASHNALLLQMGNLIAVGLTIAQRVSAESFVVFLPMHEAVYDTIAKRDGDRARKPMHELLSQTQHFMNRHAQALARNL